jgi:hypothetical protein
MKHVEKQFRDYFDAIRSADTASAPLFHCLVLTPLRRKERAALWIFPGQWIAIGAGAAAIVVAAFFFPGSQHANQASLATNDPLSAICNWTPPSDALLASGTEFWGSSSLTDQLIENESASYESSPSSL